MLMSALCENVFPGQMTDHAMVKCVLCMCAFVCPLLRRQSVCTISSETTGSLCSCAIISKVVEC